MTPPILLIVVVVVVDYRPEVYDYMLVIQDR